MKPVEKKGLLPPRQPRPLALAESSVAVACALAESSVAVCCALTESSVAVCCALAESSVAVCCALAESSVALADDGTPIARNPRLQDHTIRYRAGALDPSL